MAINEMLFNLANRMENSGDIPRRKFIEDSSRNTAALMAAGMLGGGSPIYRMFGYRKEATDPETVLEGGDITFIDWLNREYPAGIDADGYFSTTFDTLVEDRNRGKEKLTYSSYNVQHDPNSNLKKIRWSSPKASRVMVRICNNIGQTVDVIDNLQMDRAGYFSVTWDPRSKDGRGLAVGYLFAQVIIDG